MSHELVDDDDDDDNNNNNAFELPNERTIWS